MNVLQMHNLHALPADAKKYEGYSLKQLDDKLSEALDHLREYKNVNETAVYEYEEANMQWEELKRSFEQNRIDLQVIFYCFTCKDVLLILKRLQCYCCSVDA